MKAPLVRLEIKERIAWVRLDNPPMNALGDEAKEDLDRVLDALEESKSKIRVVILTGEGKAFVAGSDIPKFLQLNAEQATAQSLKTQKLFRRLEIFSRPVLCAINGYCFGAGLELAMCCDIRIASDSAILGHPEVNLGIIPGAGASQRLPRLVGLGKAKELILTGRRIKADEALQIGLVERVVPLESLLAEAQRIAEEISAKGPVALSAAKKVLNDGWDLGIEEGLELESGIWGGLFGTRDQKEGAKAFLEKRSPQFCDE
jgi:enoyl-CoA hydratase/carnithine racemase